MKSVHWQPKKDDILVLWKKEKRRGSVSFSFAEGINTRRVCAGDGARRVSRTIHLRFPFQPMIQADFLGEGTRIKGHFLEGQDGEAAHRPGEEDYFKRIH